MAGDRMVIRPCRRQFDAILAGLRLLQSSLDSGAVKPNDGDIGDILTCDGDHAGLSAAEVDALANSLLAG